MNSLRKHYTESLFYLLIFTLLLGVTIQFSETAHANALACDRLTIRKDDTGSDVRHAQNQLLKVGGQVATLIEDNGGADGHFGQGTYDAVYAYQRMVFPNDASQWDGVVGAGTWEKLGCDRGSTPITGGAVPEYRSFWYDNISVQSTCNTSWPGSTYDSYYWGGTNWVIVCQKEPAAPDCTITIPWTIDTNLRGVPTNITGADLDHAIRSIRPDSPLIGLGDDVVATGNRYGINPVYIMSHAIWESEWGTSYIAQLKNNLFGFGAYDDDPVNGAYTYDSFAHSVNDVMAFVDAQYLTSGGSYYTSHGSTLRGMNVYYATDTNWGNGIASVMNSLQNYLPNPVCSSTRSAAMKTEAEQPVSLAFIPTQLRDFW